MVLLLRQMMNRLSLLNVSIPASGIMVLLPEASSGEQKPVYCLFVVDESGVQFPSRRAGLWCCYVDWVWDHGRADESDGFHPGERDYGVATSKGCVLYAPCSF